MCIRDRVAVGLGVTGSEVIGYLIGIGLVALALVVLGGLVEAGLQRGLARLLHSVMRRIPLVRQVYEMVQKMVALFYQRDPSAARAMRAVWLRFGGETGGAAVLALQTAPEVLMVEGRPCVAVLVPTAPVPVGGGLLFVPEHWVSPAALSVEAEMCIRDSHITFEFTRMARRQKGLLRVEHARRCLDDVAVVRHRRSLDHAAAQIALQQPQTAGLREGHGGRAQHTRIAAVAR